MQRTKLAYALALTLLLAPLPASANSGPPPSAYPVERLEGRLLSLGLDEPTRKQVFGILDAARPETRELRVQIQSAQQALGELMKQDAPAEAAVLKKLDEVGKLTTDLRRKQLATVLAVRATLTPEQRAKLGAAGAAARKMPAHGHVEQGKAQGGCEKRAQARRTLSLGIAPL